MTDISREKFDEWYQEQMARGDDCPFKGKTVLDIMFLTAQWALAAAPVAQEAKTIQTLAGFRLSFAAEHGRAPTDAEFWAGGITAALTLDAALAEAAQPAPVPKS
jgi:hypothetical protein